jgi:hypothetical protein
MREKHEAHFAKFNARFSPEVVSEWTEMVVVWEKDHTKPNPYEEVDLGKSRIAVSTKLVTKCMMQVCSSKTFA